jgi:hypothetical protein
MSEYIAATLSPPRSLPAKSQLFLPRAHTAQRAFDRIVGQADAPIIEEARERLPSFERVIHRFRHIGVSREFAAFSLHPLLKGGNEWHHPGLSDGMPLRRRQTIDLALDIEDRVDTAHCLGCRRRFGNIGEFKQLASTMRLIWCTR